MTADEVSRAYDNYTKLIGKFINYRNEKPGAKVVDVVIQPSDALSINYEFHNNFLTGTRLISDYEVFIVHESVSESPPIVKGSDFVALCRSIEDRLH